MKNETHNSAYCSSSGFRFHLFDLRLSCKKLCDLSVKCSETWQFCALFRFYGWHVSLSPHAWVGFVRLFSSIFVNTSLFPAWLLFPLSWSLQSISPCVLSFYIINYQVKAQCPKYISSTCEGFFLKALSVLHTIMLETHKRRMLKGMAKIEAAEAEVLLLSCMVKI